MKASLHVNGEMFDLDAPPGTSLADVLRNQLELTGVKRGCDSGGCGMCTVLLDNEVVFSCMTPFWRAEGRNLLTIEGLERGGELDRVQEAFIKNNSAQCGYCTPAMVLAAKSLLDSNPEPSEEEIRDALCGVLCRCTGYQPYFDAVRDLSETADTRSPELSPSD